MIQEIYDYNILFFNKKYKNIILYNVVDKIFDKKHAETKFIFIKDLEENKKPIFDSMTLPYAVVNKIRVSLYYLEDNIIIKRDNNIRFLKHNINKKSKNTIRIFQNLKRTGGVKRYFKKVY